MSTGQLGSPPIGMIVPHSYPVASKTSTASEALGVVEQARAPGSLIFGKRQTLESDVVDDHTRSRQHQIAAIACAGVRIRPRYLKHTSDQRRRDYGRLVGQH